MLDAVHASYHRVPQALATVRVSSYFMLMAMRLIHNRLQFGQRKRRLDVQLAVGAEEIARSWEYFDPIGPVTNLFPNDFARLVNPVTFLIPSGDGCPWSSD